MIRVMVDGESSTITDFFFRLWWIAVLQGSRCSFFNMALEKIRCCGAQDTQLCRDFDGFCSQI